MIDKRAAGTVGLATFLFSLALLLRSHVDPWLTTSVSAVLVLAAARREVKLVFHELRTSAAGPLAAAALFGVLLLLVTHGAYTAVASAIPTIDAHVSSLYSSIDTGHTLSILVLTTAVVVLAEEVVWRGLAVDALRGRRHWTWYAVLLYALPQVVGGEPLLICAALLLGSLFLAIRTMTGRLIEATVCHAVWSIGVFCLFPLTS